MTSPWTHERIETLTRLWAEGTAASVIGRKMGFSKNAVVGKAHRMNLGARPSPIIHGGSAKQRRTKALASLAETVAKPSPQPDPIPTPVCQPRRTCLFIEGEKGRDFGLYLDAPRCSTPAKPGSPYCGLHHDLTHIKLQPRVTA